MKTTLLLSTFIIIVFASSCIKDNMKDNEYYAGNGIDLKPLGDAKDYILAAPGSYWIYKNTNSGAFDTQRLINFEVDLTSSTQKQRDGQSYILEYNRVFRTLSCSYSNQSILEKTNDFFTNPDVYANNKIVLLRRMNKGTANIFFYPFVERETVSNTNYTGMDSIMKVQGEEYQMVAKFEVIQDHSWEGSEPYPNTIYYFAKGVGLIKRQALEKGDAWELVNYYVIKSN